MSIPRIIHYGSFGGWRLSSLNLRCIESWKRLMPDCEIRFWNDDTCPRGRFIEKALSSKPINVHNYMKWWVLNEFGGVFVDNDIELIKPLDLNFGVFVGFQRDDLATESINTAILGSIPGHSFIRRCLARVEEKDGDYAWPVLFGCTIPTEEVMRLGEIALNQEKQIGDVMVYSKERFYPWRWDQQPNAYSVTDKTLAIHHWEGSWQK